VTIKVRPHYTLVIAHVIVFLNQCNILSALKLASESGIERQPVTRFGGVYGKRAVEGELAHF
jgi:hypothetical protein